MEGLAVLGAGVLVDVAGLDHVAGPLQHLLDAVADQRLVAGVRRLDLGAGGPHQRADGEDVAAGAGAGQEVALHVAAERGDLVGVFAEFGEARRRLVRVEPGLLEQVLVVEERRDVGVERHAVEAAVIGRHRHVAGARGLQFGPVLDLVGDVDELAGLLELRRVDQVHAHQVGHVAGGDGLGELGHHLGVRDVGQVDLAVGILRVPHRDQRIDHALVAAAPLPHHQVGGHRRCRHRHEGGCRQANGQYAQGFLQSHGFPPVSASRRRRLRFLAGVG